MVCACASLIACLLRPFYVFWLGCFFDLLGKRGFIRRARTSTELAVIAEVSPSTASVHCAKLREQNLVTVVAQGKHRYYQLTGQEVATALEALMAIAGLSALPFVPSTPDRLRHARTCYDHMAGEVAVALHDHFLRLVWLLPTPALGNDRDTYQLSRDFPLGFEMVTDEFARQFCVILFSHSELWENKIT